MTIWLRLDETRLPPAALDALTTGNSVPLFLGPCLDSGPVEALPVSLPSDRGPENAAAGEAIALTTQTAANHLIGHSRAMQLLRRRIEHLAARPTNLLIIGDRGVGKGLVAEAFHEHAHNGAAPFIPFPCSSWTESSLRRALGEVTKAGRRATLFLDEVSDLPLAGQTQLLAWVREGPFAQAGGRLRLVASTAVDLILRLVQRRFHSELYDALVGSILRVPPLRERLEDLPGLAAHFITRFGARHGNFLRGISQPALEQLRRRRWPGNVRELEVALERAVACAPGPMLLSRDLAL